jgi:hypothetical protein
MILSTTIEIFFNSFKVESYKSTGGPGYRRAPNR